MSTPYITTSSPLYSVSALSSSRVVVGGGGGRAATGVLNVLEAYKKSKTNSWEKEKEIQFEDAVMSLNVESGRKWIAASIGPNTVIIPLSKDGVLETNKDKYAVLQTEDPKDEAHSQRTCVILHDSNLLVTGGTSGKIRLLSYQANAKGKDKPLSVVAEAEFSCAEKNDGITDLDASSNGRLIVSYARDNQLRLWQRDAAVLRCVASVMVGEQRSLHGYVLRCARFARRDNAVLYALATKPKCPALLTTWKIETQEGKDKKIALVLASSRKVFGEPLVSMAIAPDDSHIACGAPSGEVVVVNLARGSSRAVQRHSFFVSALSFSGDAEDVFSVSGDRTLNFTSVKSLGSGTAVSPLALVLALIVLILAILLYRFTL